jgi:hypothetical protein
MRVYEYKDDVQRLVHLAIWRPAGTTWESQQVVIVTSRPSWWYQLSRGFD